MYKNSSSLLCKIIWFSWVLFASTQLAHAMEFRWAGTGGNCVGCTWIVAEGEITRETPQQFKKFLKEEDPGVFIVVLHSPGGNLFGGIELGRIIRENGFHTKVGKSFRPTHCKTENDCPSYYEEFDAAACMSACAYAFLGGKHRVVASENSFTGHPDSVIGFHQFYGDLDKTSRIAEIIEEETYFSRDQFISALLLRYITDMGADPNILGLAALAGPDEMEFPNQSQRKLLKIDYQPDFSFAELDLEVYKGGLLGFSRPAFDNELNNLEQITFYCRAPNTLNILLTFPRIADSYTMISREFGNVVMNLNKGPDWYDHDNNTFELNYDRVKQWSDAGNSYISFTLNKRERRQILNAQEVAVNINVARAFGAYLAYVKLDEQSYDSLQLISKTCF